MQLFKNIFCRLIAKAIVLMTLSLKHSILTFEKLFFKELGSVILIILQMMARTTHLMAVDGTHFLKEKYQVGNYL